GAKSIFSNLCGAFSGPTERPLRHALGNFKGASSTRPASVRELPRRRKLLPCLAANQDLPKGCQRLCREILFWSPPPGATPHSPLRSIDRNGVVGVGTASTEPD